MEIYELSIINEWLQQQIIEGACKQAIENYHLQQTSSLHQAGVNF